MTAWFQGLRSAVDLMAAAARRRRRPTAWQDRTPVRFLWPVFTRQILVRERRLSHLNLFQEYTLRLCNAGVRSAEEIARLLLKPSDGATTSGPSLLFVRIMEELRSRELLDPNGRVTQAGRDLIEGAESEAMTLTDRILFQDAWTGALWNRFSANEELQPCLFEFSAKAREGALFADMPQGAKPRYRGYIVDPGELPACPQPNEADIKRHFALFARDWHMFAERTQDADRHEEEENELADEPRAIEEIVSIGEARPMFLQLAAFLPDQKDASSLWQMADPFGLGTSQECRQAVDVTKRRPELGHFAGWLGQRLAEVDNRDGESDMAIRSERAIDKMLGDLARKSPVLYNELLEMQRAAFGIAAPLAEGRTREAATQVRLAILGAQVSLEYLFKELADRFPTTQAYGSFDLVPGERKGTAAELTRAAALLNFDGAAVGTKLPPLPDRLTHVDAGKIRRACDFREGSLNALVWAAVLTAAARPEKRHPFQNVAERYPEMLLDLSMIAGLRDEVSHAVSEPHKYVGSVEAVVEKAYRIVDTLLRSA
jgi:hypothetical protein